MLTWRVNKEVQIKTTRSYHYTLWEWLHWGLAIPSTGIPQARCGLASRSLQESEYGNNASFPVPINVMFTLYHFPGLLSVQYSIMSKTQCIYLNWKTLYCWIMLKIIWAEGKMVPLDKLDTKLPQTFHRLYLPSTVKRGVPVLARIWNNQSSHTRLLLLLGI